MLRVQRANESRACDTRAPDAHSVVAVPGGCGCGGGDGDGQTVLVLLFPSDPLNPRRADPHFAEEYAAARELGLATALIDHDLAAGGDPTAAVSKVPPTQDAIYRGWMLRSDEYAALTVALNARGTTLRTGSDQYRPAHELPGWYADAVAELELPFVAVDFAQRRDGTWRVVELGDGQVSDRPTSTAATEFIAILFGPNALG